MKRRPSLELITTACVSLLAYRAVCAHHSFAGFYDADNIVEIEGVISSISWRNPHGKMTIAVASEDGETNEWTIETGSISVLRARGLAREFVAVGDRVRVAGEMALRNSTGLYARNMLLDDGREVLLSIGIEPRWTDPGSGALLESRFDASAVSEAHEAADGIFRVWSTVLDDPAAFPMFKGNYPLTGRAERLRSEWDASNIELLGCQPKGMPSLMITPYAMEFVRRDDTIEIRFEEDDAIRTVHMGRGRNDADPSSSLLGYSRGRWEGNTLVVETTRIDAGLFDSDGTPQSAAIETLERFTLDTANDRLDYRIRITDPEMFTEPFELTRYWVWTPGLTVNPYDCQAR